MDVNEKMELVQLIKQAVKEVIIPLESDMNQIKGRIDYLETGMENIKYEVKNVQMYLSSVDYDIREIKLDIENHVKPGIQILVEGHQSNVNNIKDLKEIQEDMGSTVLALDIVHSAK